MALARIAQSCRRLLLATIFLGSVCACAELLDFWVKHPSFAGHIEPGTTIPIEVRGRYGTVTQAMIWDQNGEVLGGYTRTDKQDVQIGGLCTLELEKRGAGIKDWTVVETRDVPGAGPHLFSITEPGTYRIKAALKPGVKTVFAMPVPVRYSAVFDVYKQAKSASGLLDYWLDGGSFAQNRWVGEPIVIRTLGNYGTVQAMMWDNQGRIIGGYTKNTREKVPVGEAYTLNAEKSDDEGKTWTTVQPLTGGNMDPRIFTPTAEGLYRFRAELAPGTPTVFPLGPRYTSVLEVYDRRYNRSQGIYRIAIRLPKGYAGGGISIDGSRDGCGAYSFYSDASAGRFSIESRSGCVVEATAKPAPYLRARWVLKAMYWEGKTYAGKVLAETASAGSFSFDCSYWGDGEYQLEAHLADADQGQGLQNYRVQPATVSIRIMNCGPGRLPPEQQAVKDTAGKGGAPAAAVKDWLQQEVKLPVLKDHGIELQKLVQQDFLAPNADPPPRRPANLNAECPELLQQIVHREKQLGISCDPAIALMNRLVYELPQKYIDLAKEQEKWIQEGNDLLLKGRADYDALAKRWAAFSEAGEKNKIFLPAEVKAKFKAKASDGSLPRLGDGVPLEACEFDPARILILRELNLQQLQILEDWEELNRQPKGKAFGELQKRLKGINEALEMAQGLFEMLRQEHAALKDKLAALFYSGTYEHGLGMAGEFSGSGERILRMDKDGNFTAKAGNHHAGLPGMNVNLPAAPKLQLPELKDSYPPPKYREVKRDGTEQIMTDCYSIALALDAKQAELYANSGTWWISFINTIKPASKLLGADFIFAYDTNTSPPKGNFAVNMYNRYTDWGKGAAMFGVSVLGSLRDAITKTPVYEENPLLRQVVYDPLESSADAVVKMVRGWETEIPQVDPEFCQACVAAVKKGDQAAIRGLMLQIQQAVEAITAVERKIEGAQATQQVVRDAVMSALGSFGKIDKVRELQAGFTKQLGKVLDDLKQVRHDANLQKVINQQTSLQKQVARIEQRLQGGTITNLAARAKLNKLLAEIKDLQRQRRTLEFDLDAWQKRRHDMALDAFERHRQKQAAAQAWEAPPERQITQADLGEEIGGGAFGTVYKNSANPDEVLKVIRDPLSYARELDGARLLQEAGLEHAQIVARQTLDGSGGVLVKELIGESAPRIQGTMMKDWLKSNPMDGDLREAIVRYTNQANQSGLLLTDFKPSNCYVYRKGGRLEIGLIESDGIYRASDLAAKLNELRDLANGFGYNLPEVTPQLLQDKQALAKVAAEYQHYQMTHPSGSELTKFWANENQVPWTAGPWEGHIGDGPNQFKARDLEFVADPNKAAEIAVAEKIAAVAAAPEKYLSGGALETFQDLGKKVIDGTEQAGKFLYLQEQLQQEIEKLEKEQEEAEKSKQTGGTGGKDEGAWLLPGLQFSPAGSCWRLAA